MEGGLEREFLAVRRWAGQGETYRLLEINPEPLGRDGVLREVRSDGEGQPALGTG